MLRYDICWEHESLVVRANAALVMFADLPEWSLLESDDILGLTDQIYFDGLWRTVDECGLIGQPCNDHVCRRRLGPSKH